MSAERDQGAYQAVQRAGVGGDVGLEAQTLAGAEDGGAVQREGPESRTASPGRASAADGDSAGERAPTPVVVT
ncbi:hypothetical protein NKH77_50880 [Streptomyces sp. M19]